jgi:TonB family protein
MNRLTALGGALALLCMQVAQADLTARFPEELWFTSINEGYATVAWTVAPDGRIEDAVVIAASHPAFAQSALEALPRRLPRDVDSVLPKYDSARFIFHRLGLNTYSSTAEMIRQTAAEQRGAIPTVTVRAGELQEPLVQTGGEASVCPSRQSMLAGAVIVRFLIDRDGRVRVPRIIDTTSDQFALAMLAAVRQWRFAPPQVAGQSVQVEDTQVFTVNPTEACVVFKPKAQAQVAGR